MHMIQSIFKITIVKDQFVQKLLSLVNNRIKERKKNETNNLQEENKIK